MVFLSVVSIFILPSLQVEERHSLPLGPVGDSFAQWSAHILWSAYGTRGITTLAPTCQGYGRSAGQSG